MLKPTPLPRFPLFIGQVQLRDAVRILGMPIDFSSSNRAQHWKQANRLVVRAINS